MNSSSEQCLRSNQRLLRNNCRKILVQYIFIFVVVFIEVFVAKSLLRWRDVEWIVQWNLFTLVLYTIVPCWIIYSIGKYFDVSQLSAVSVRFLKAVFVLCWPIFNMFFLFALSQPSAHSSLFAASLKELDLSNLHRICLFVDHSRGYPVSASTSDGELISAFVETIAGAYGHKVNHDTHKTEGTIRLEFKDGDNVSFSWYVLKRPPYSLILTQSSPRAHASVPNLEKIFAAMRKEGFDN